MSDATPVRGETAPRIAELDGLRGIAIALVLWSHLVVLNLPLSYATWLGWLRGGTRLAWCGVDLFFVLSGFLIGGILLERRDSPRLARAFYLRRACRILPLYYVTLCGLFWFSHHGGWRNYPGWIYATFTTNFALATSPGWDWLPFSVLWSLAVEEQFYLFAPWLVRLISPQRLPWLLAAVPVAALAARLGLQAFLPELPLAPQVLVFCRPDGFALGALTAWAVRANSAAAWRARLRARWRTWLGLALLADVALAAVNPVIDDPRFALVAYSIFAVTFAVAVAVVVVVQPLRLNAMLRVPILRRLGRHSYFVYLWHAPVWLALVPLLTGSPMITIDSPSTAGVVVVAVAVVWAGAAISWRYFEQPLIVFGHRHGRWA